MDHSFCRCYLKIVMEDVRKHFSQEEIKKSSVYISKCFGKRLWEFWGPESFYTHGQGCCKWWARSQGWEAYMRQKGIE